MLESDLRRMIKAIWPDVELIWTEAAHGGTYGQPDVSIPLTTNAKINSNWRLPVELKFWKQTKKGVCCQLRPTQIRYHTVEALAGRRSAIIAGVETDDGFDLLAIPGHACPREQYPKNIRGRRFINAHELKPIELRAKLECLFNAKTFWER